MQPRGKEITVEIIEGFVLLESEKAICSRILLPASSLSLSLCLQLSHWESSSSQEQ